MLFPSTEDANLVIKEINGKCLRQIAIEEHYVIVSEPDEFYLPPVAPINRTGGSISQSVFYCPEEVSYKATGDH